MASSNLRWFCAPLLFVSSLALSQGAPDLPPVFTQYVVPYSDLISTPRGDGACVAGYVEAICSTGGTNQCFSYKEDDGNYYMRVRSTGYYCGSWADYNDPSIAYPDYDYENIKPEHVPAPPIDWEFSDLTSRCGDVVRYWIFYGDHYGARKDAELMDFPVSCYFSYLLDHDNLRKLDIHELQILVSATRDYVRGFNDYMVDSLNSKSDKYIVDFIDSRLTQIEYEIKNSDIDIQEVLDSIESIGGELSGVYREISSLRVEMYGQINGLRAETNDSLDSFSGELAVVRKDIRDTEFRIYDSVFPAIGEVYGHVGNEIGGVYEHVGAEIASLTADIEASNDGIASSIDSQTGEIIGAIDGQTGEIVGAIDGQSSIISDGFSDLTDFFGDGEPSAGDLASQDSELSGLVSDYDYFVDYNIDIGEAVCPAPYQLDLAITGKTVYVSFEPMCEASVLVKPLLIAASSVAFALIVMGVRRA